MKKPKPRFLSPLEDFGEIEEIKKDIVRQKGMVDIEGCLDSQRLHLVYGLPFIGAKKIKKRLIVTYDEIRARQLLNDYRFFEQDVVFYPAKDLMFFQADIKGNLLTKERMEAMRVMASDEYYTVITTIDALMEQMSGTDLVSKNTVEIKVGDTLDERSFSLLLTRLGYERVSRVEDVGHFAMRGGIIDVYSMTKDNPYRIELWGDEVTSIRAFDCESQRSVENLEEISILPARELILTQEEKLAGLVKIEEEAKAQSEKLRGEFKTQEAHRIDESIKELRESITEGFFVDLDAYMPYFYTKRCSVLDFFDRKDTIIFIDEPGRVSEKGQAIENEFKENMQSRIEKGYALSGQADILYPVGYVFDRLQIFMSCGLYTIRQRSKVPYKAHNAYHLTVKQVNSYNNSFDALCGDLERYVKNKFRVLLLSPSVSRGRRMADELLQRGFTAFYSEADDRVLKSGEIMVTKGQLNRGFEYPLTGYVVICESDIFTRTIRKKPKKKDFHGMSRDAFMQLNVGDYVVHESHGIGIYKGIEQITVDKVVKDYMKIAYRDDGNLYIPATDFAYIQKYASADAKKPKINKLGTAEWSRTKKKVVTAVDEVAKDLVLLYYKRRENKGFVYGEDTVWQREFEELFPYEETSDQLRAIEDTKKDMMSTKIMDRLICGDVGFGKTEVALRAAFKAVQENKQVAFLVPTTILASQHYNNFVQRLKNFPVRVELMCRFRTPGQLKKTANDLEKGLVDIVVGTHRLLSNDVKFKDLGLLVIDEEQRFGVAHKEKIKKLKENVDVLALSATPIPRTLHMSIAGIRDMSLLEEAPDDRMPIQTYVMEFNEEMIREAISREIRRNGQVYYVYNRINTISQVAAMISELVPEARVEYAHGRMNEAALEELMADFVNGEIDVLVSTTIIETGLDIPNVNTIIIHDSDRMGLSQLYQLRGRVGRSGRTAYAFLMYKRDKLLKAEAEKRLSAIREFTDLGSGFRIAMKDLEIRGAGNILGKSQHGHMEAVGYELYCKLLNEAVKKAMPEKEGGSSRPSLDYETAVNLEADAFIPGTYIANESAKLDMYKRIAAIEDEDEAMDLMSELKDRFGQAPESVKNLVDISLLRALAHECYMEEVMESKEFLEFKMYPKAPIDPAAIMEILSVYGGRMSFKNGEKPALIYRRDKDDAPVLELTRTLLSQMKEKL
ncbi:MAG: transcription-repair coupling factor [Lachnospiraceae bacterium]|nr:transcription-repair coupling factor [Lachnospiraceae bacterium]